MHKREAHFVRFATPADGIAGESLRWNGRTLSGATPTVIASAEGAKQSHRDGGDSIGVEIASSLTSFAPRNDRVELVPITEVQPGDYVLSLNEDTQAIEPHRINALLDMGIKPVFRLTTEDGRTIRTTGNHPYLVKVEGRNLPFRVSFEDNLKPAATAVSGGKL